MGKTTFALAVAENMAEQGPVLFVSLEMSNAQIAAKRVARESGLSATTLLMGKPTDVERQRANEAVEKLKKSQMHVNRKTYATVADIASMARKIKGIRCIVIDYFGLIRPETQAKSRYEAYTDISWKLKSLARQLDIPILCLAQLNRENMGRKGNKPALSDLRDTGALEQDADGVLFLHREDYYEDADVKQLDPWEPVPLEIIVAKNRHGGTGVCEAAFYMGAGRIVPIRR
jgi:replicative DNA helicase